jgi:hypothetical protein
VLGNEGVEQGESVGMALGAVHSMDGSVQDGLRTRCTNRGLKKLDKVES